MGQHPLIQEFRASVVKRKLQLLRQLQDRTDPEVDTLLLQALQDPSAKVRNMALNLLHRRNQLEPERVVKMLRDPSKTVRQTALRLLQHWPDPAYIDAVRPFLQASDLSFRLLAVDWLARVGEPALAALVLLQDDPMLSIRERVRSLIQGRLPARPDLPLMPAAHATAAAVREPEAADLLELLRTGNPEQRRRALQQISHLQDPNLIPGLAELLAEADWELRDAVIDLLKGWPNLPAYELEPLLEHPLWYVRAAAVEILGHHRAPVLVEAAFDLAGDANVEVRRALAQALQYYGGQEDVLLVLEKLSRDAHFHVRRVAKRSLFQIRERAVEKG